MQFGFEAGNKMSESSQHITLDGQYSVQFLVSRGYSECLFNSFIHSKTGQEGMWIKHSLTITKQTLRHERYAGGIHNRS